MVGTVQNVIGAVPVRYVNPPPEGPRALPVQVTLPIGVTVAAKLLNLSDWGMSQVVSAIIDNSLSDVDLTVTMGVTNANTTVPAFAIAVVPAFSNGPSFNMLVVASSLPDQIENIVITLLNFEKQPAIYSFAPINVTGTLNANITNASINANITNASLAVTGTVNANITNASLAVTGSVNANITNASLAVTGSVNANITGGSVAISSGTVDATITNSTITVVNNLVNSGHNSGPLASSLFNLNGNGNFTILGSGNWVLDSLDIAVEVVQSTAAGACAANFAFTCGGSTFHDFYASCNAAGALLTIPGIGVNAPSYRSWGQGMALPRGNTITCAVTGWLNYQGVIIRVNISGYNAP